MSKTACVERTLTQLDVARLRKLTLARAVPQLAELLDEAEVVESRAVPQHVITMYAHVEIEDPATRRRQIVVVCYPDDAQPALGYISVLSPLGTSLLGLPEGGVARWQGPDGQDHAAAVRAILFQPEAAGDYVT
jgi:regulator of nucleoside diphosphate kinase